LRSVFLRKAVAVCLGGILICSAAIPASAFFWNKKAEKSITHTTRNVPYGGTLTFSAEDFSSSQQESDPISSITITALPDRACGILSVGTQPLEQGEVIRLSALNGLRFQAMNAPTLDKTFFTYTPSFSSGTKGNEVTVELFLLQEQNQSPISENLSLSTYKNIPVTGYFQAVDAEGDPLTFQITDTPARGSVTLAEDGTGRFVYTPYENKTGKDSFTYVSVDSAGNISNPAKVSVRIEKAATSVTYSDMDGNPAHKAALRLAEEGVFVGECVNGHYFFSPDSPVTRSQFLSMAMSVAGLDPLEQVSTTGFADDLSIPTWAKGYVSSALMAGAIHGTRDDLGRVIFNPDSTVTRAEATVILNNLLDVSDVAVQTWSAIGMDSDTQNHWAVQAAANLTTTGVIRPEHSTIHSLDTSLTRADVADMLNNSLDVIANRKPAGWFVR